MRTKRTNGLCFDMFFWSIQSSSDTKSANESTWRSTFGGTLMKNMIKNSFSNESYKKFMCEIIFLKQGNNKKMRSYVKKTKKLESRFHVLLRKDEKNVNFTMIGIRMILTKNFVEVLKPNIQS